ncbi:anti-repressor protein [Gammaproteobacteria bacterium]
MVLEAKVQVLAPKAEITDRIATADGALGLQAAAKALQQRPNKFCDWLREHRWIYHRPGGSSNLGYQDKIQAGYLTHKVHTVHKEDGTEKVVEQVLITPRGLTKLAALLNANNQQQLLKEAA